MQLCNQENAIRPIMSKHLSFYADKKSIAYVRGYSFFLIPAKVLSSFEALLWTLAGCFRSPMQPDADTYFV